MGLHIPGMGDSRDRVIIGSHMMRLLPERTNTDSIIDLVLLLTPEAIPMAATFLLDLMMRLSMIRYKTIITIIIKILKMVNITKP